MKSEKNNPYPHGLYSERCTRESKGGKWSKQKQSNLSNVIKENSVKMKSNKCFTLHRIVKEELLEKKTSKLRPELCEWAMNLPNESGGKQYLQRPLWEKTFERVCHV